MADVNVNANVTGKEEKLGWYEEFVEVIKEFNIDSVLEVIAKIEGTVGTETQEKVDEINDMIKELKLSDSEELLIFEKYHRVVKSFKNSSEATKFVKKKLERKSRLLENRIKRVISKDFGTYLKELRDNKGYSLKEVELITGISPSYINRIEKGERNAPSYPIIEKLATAYNIPVQDLLASAGLNVEETTNVKSFSQIMFTNNFTLNGSMVSAQQKELIIELVDKLERVEWSAETQHIDTLGLFDVISRYKAIKK